MDLRIFELRCRHSRRIDGLVYKPFLVKVSRKEEKDGAKARV
jgi:hypothetical protein